MTVIAGYEGVTHVYLATDTEEQVGNIHTHDVTKAVQVGPCWVGCTGISLWERFLGSQNHEALLSEGEEMCPPSGFDWVEGAPVIRDRWYWWAAALAEAWHNWAKERGHGTQQDAMHYHEGGLLCATPGGLYSVDSSGGVRRRKMYAMGCGQGPAMGAIATLRRHMTPQSGRFLVEEAVHTAIELSPGCGGYCLSYVVQLERPVAPPAESAPESDAPAP